jgi:hypothetical protein
MLAYSETQARALAELDAVVGRSRLPSFADLPQLPYIRAMVKEALRWRPIAPSGPPHRITEDYWYEGTVIPEGTVRIPNVWHLNRDPRDPWGRTRRSLTRRGISMQVGTLRPACPRSRNGDISRMGLGAESASVATFLTTRSSSTLQSCYGRPKLVERNLRKTHPAVSFLWIWMDGWMVA